jgi:hypothetical protein
MNAQGDKYGTALQAASANGSFGPHEDNYFDKCTKLACKLGIPRIYLAANSGDRLGCLP